MDAAFLDALKESFGFSSFRPHQEEIVSAVVAGRDVFAALPTGGGKSLCYQLPSLLGPGLTVVVSPLIALMHDQVQAARQNGLAAAFLNSTLSPDAAARVWRDVITGSISLLYVSPERLALDNFRQRLPDVGVRLFAVDEAHCISEWGHEFRPDYRMLSTLRDEFPESTIAAFTATATHQVQEDVIRLLGLRTPLVVRGDFDRKEIFYRVRRKDRPADQIREFVLTHRNDPGIVYRATRKAVDQTVVALRRHGVKALPYHAGLDDRVRETNQELFVRDEVGVIVATIAFGMGIDKSNVRWVLHGDLPRSLEAYYQESGRAGRDGEPAEAHLLFGPQDLITIRYHIDRMENPEEQERARMNLRGIMRYANSGVCRRVQLLAHFDQDHPGDCGGCDICEGEVPLEDRTVAAQMAMSAMVRTGERFGAHHVADVVCGAETDRVRQFRHDRIPTFGVGAKHPREWWLTLINDLEAAGMIRRKDGAKSGLMVSDAGKEVLYGREAFHTAIRPETSSGGRQRTRTTGRAEGASPGPSTSGRAPGDALSESVQEGLFQCLRSLRRALARSQGVPPYVIFSDRSIREMVRFLPTTPDDFLLVHGVGSKKAERYGDAFTGAVGRYLESGECAGVGPDQAD